MLGFRCRPPAVSPDHQSGHTIQPFERPLARRGRVRRADREQQHHIGGGESCTICIEWLRQAASLFRGDLLTGFTLRDSVSFEEWQVVQQEALRIQAIDTLDRLAGYYELRGEPEQVQGYARRLVALEPWHEPAQLKLLAALVASGQAAAALEQFAAYSRLLATEFGMKPSVAARSLYDQIRVQRRSGQTPRTRWTTSPARGDPHRVNAGVTRRTPVSHGVGVRPAFAG